MWWWSSEEGGGDSGVDGDVEAGGVAEVAGAEDVDGVGDVFGEDFAFEEGALGVVLAEVFFVDAVDGGPFRAPAAGEDAGAADHPVGVDAVDFDPMLTQLGGEEPDLVGLVGFGRGVGDVVRPAKTEFLEEM